MKRKLRGKEKLMKIKDRWKEKLHDRKIWEEGCRNCMIERQEEGRRNCMVEKYGKWGAIIG
jgi:hypothetical protein